MGEGRPLAHLFAAGHDAAGMRQGPRLAMKAPVTRRWTVLLVGVMQPGLHEALAGAGATVCAAAGALDAEHVVATREIDAVAFLHPGALSLAPFRRDAGERLLPLLALLPVRAGDELARALAQGWDEAVRDDTPPAEVAGRLARLVTLRARVDELLAEQRRLADLSQVDGLTGLGNRRAFDERLAEEFLRAQRYDDHLALVMADVDHFKQVNDAFGHLVGDEVLQSVAQALEASVRETDFIGRYGGEEFGVLLPRTNLAGALTVAERIGTELRRLKVGAHATIRVTASLGVSGYPGRNVTSPESLVRTADEALFKAKRDGRNRIAIYQPPLAQVG